MRLKGVREIIVLLTAVVWWSVIHLAIAESSESPPLEQQVKESIERVAKSVICFDDRLLETADIDREQCEFTISLYSSDCWNVLDQWVSDYELKDTPEDKAKYERIVGIYTMCQESKFLKFWIVKSSSANPD